MNLVFIARNFSGIAIANENFLINLLLFYLCPDISHLAVPGRNNIDGNVYLKAQKSACAHLERRIKSRSFLALMPRLFLPTLTKFYIKADIKVQF